MKEKKLQTYLRITIATSIDNTAIMAFSKTNEESTAAPKVVIDEVNSWKLKWRIK